MSAKLRATMNFGAVNRSCEDKFRAAPAAAFGAAFALATMATELWPTGSRFATARRLASRTPV